MIDEIRELFQTLIAPRLEGIEGEFKEVRLVAMDRGMESLRRELLAEIRAAR